MHRSVLLDQSFCAEMAFWLFRLRLYVGKAKRLDLIFVPYEELGFGYLGWVRRPLNKPVLIEATYV